MGRRRSPRRPSQPKLPTPPRLPGTRHLVIPDELHGDLELVYAIPRDDEPWGAYALLRGTSWESRVIRVTGIALSRALCGDTQGLRNQLGRPPIVDARRVPESEAWCAKGQDKTCGMAGPNCRPGSGSLPQCYLAPGLDLEVAYVAAAVALEWEEGRYVAVVLGEGFVL